MYRSCKCCVECHGELTIDQVYYSHGVCPLCGHCRSKPSTVVDYYEKVYRLIRINPWWKFWKQQFERSNKT